MGGGTLKQPILPTTLNYSLVAMTNVFQGGHVDIRISTLNQLQGISSFTQVFRPFSTSDKVANMNLGWKLGVSVARICEDIVTTGPPPLKCEWVA